jgi:hypothetical protein
MGCRYSSAAEEKHNCHPLLRSLDQALRLRIQPKGDIMRLALFAFGALMAAIATGAAGDLANNAGDSPANQLTEQERQAGWRLLFDGKTAKGWRGFRSDAFPERGWTVADGCLKHTNRGGGGDIITDGEYADFEFAFEWKVGPRANSGVKYFVDESRGRIGHEYQLLDDHASWGKGDRKHCTASFYDVLPVSGGGGPKPAGQFNQSRIVVRGNHVEHWLNGEVTVAYRLGSPEVLAAVAGSKFKNTPRFGTKARGHILLQDHGGEICYRNLKIRELPAEPSP